MTFILLFLIILTLGYVGVAWACGRNGVDGAYGKDVFLGLPESLSETSYLFDRVFGKYYLFTIYCFTVGFTLLPIWILKSPDEYAFLAFISCTGMLAAGSTPFFKERFERKIHYPAAILSVVGYVGWMGVMGFMGFMGIAGMVCGGLILISPKRYMLFLEVCCLISLLVVLIFI